MKCASVNISFAAQQMRFDGSFHLSDGLEVRRMIKNSPYGLSTIRDITKDIYCPGIFRRNYTKSGYAFLGGGDIQKADYDSGKYLKKIRTPNWEILEVKKGWTLVTCGGTIGDTVFTNNLLAKCWVSQHVMRVIPNDSIKEGMLYAYLATKYGKLLLTTGTYGSVIPTISSENIAVLPIPNFPDSFQKEVDDLVQQSATLREQAAAKLDEAKKMLASFVNVSFDKKMFKTEKVTSKDILESLQYRLDPPAHINDGVKTMEEVATRFICKKVGDIDAKVYRPGIFKRNYVANGIPYIKGSEIFLTNPFRRCEQLSRTRTPFIEEMTLSEGQILMTCAGSVGDVKMITKEYQEKQAIGSQDIIRIESHDELFTREYLFTYFQLPFVYDYIQSMKYGSVIERIEPFHVESIPVIQPTKVVSESISDLVKEYMNYTYRAFCAEEKAITMVEQEIEKWQSPTA